MVYKAQRPAGWPGAGDTVFGENSKSKFDYNTPCSCHIRSRAEHVSAGPRTIEA
jgi:hypothetical protein